MTSSSLNRIRLPDLGWVELIQRTLFLNYYSFMSAICHGGGSRSHGACCHATTNPAHCGTWAVRTWLTPAVHPIRAEDRCSQTRVSEAETCWFRGGDSYKRVSRRVFYKHELLHHKELFIRRDIKNNKKKTNTHFGFGGEKTRQLARA